MEDILSGGNYQAKTHEGTSNYLFFFLVLLATEIKYLLTPS